MSGIFHRNIVLMLVSIAVIPIMASLNAPSLSTKIGSIRPRPNSTRMEAVVEA
jgi:Tfp pilus assembly protein FimT